MSAPTGPAAVSEEHLAEAVGRARAALAARSDEVDLLNVFPVADADTGTNMLFTMRSAATWPPHNRRASADLYPGRRNSP